ncbi:hypothetical protein ACFLRI_02270 [Bacteroidota bacterium]
MFLWPASTHVELTKQGEKKLDKLLEEIFPGNKVDFQLEDISFPESYGQKDIYSLLQDSVLIGYVVISTAKGRYEYFDYCIIYNLDFQIKSLGVLVYRSDHGYEICNKKWLEQFAGMKAGDQKVFGKDIDAISGATFSATSITRDINLVNATFSKLIITKN